MLTAVATGTTAGGAALNVVNVSGAYVTALMDQGMSLPVLVSTGDGAEAQEVRYTIHKKLGSGGFADVFLVSAEGSEASGAGSSSSSSSNSRQLIALKVFSCCLAGMQLTTQHTRSTQMTQQQQQPSTLPRLVNVPSSDTQLDEEQLQEQQQQQTFVPFAPSSELQQASAKQPLGSAGAASGGGGISRPGQPMQEQDSDVASDGGTTVLPEYLREAPQALEAVQIACNQELYYMLLARGDALTASIAKGVDSSLRPAAKPESELCPCVLAVQGWGKFIMDYEELQAPVLLLELATMSLRQLLRAINATNPRPFFLRGDQLHGLTRQETLYLALQILQALHSAHKAGIVHRDFKSGEHTA
jgi:serine/threonine protein kinase